MAYRFKPGRRPYAFRSGLGKGLLEKARRPADRGELLTVEGACQAYRSIAGKEISPSRVKRIARKYTHVAVFDHDGNMLGIDSKRWSYFVSIREMDP
ncbi:MAG: hypothetical protein LBP92_06670 [Deltaproteobacteria bacterium]|jgi:hypothetical protein|nr:hypothetical protein [Deltaproteobacteria bacterium]